MVCMSDDFIKISEQQKERRKLNRYPHRLSRKGYSRFAEEIADGLCDDDDINRATIWKKGQASKGGQFDGDELRKTVEKISNIVAYGTVVCVGGDDKFLHGAPLPKNFMRVSIDEALDKSKPLPFPIIVQCEVIDDAVGTHVAWPHHLVVLRDEPNSSADELSPRRGPRGRRASGIGECVRIPATNEHLSKGAGDVSGETPPMLKWSRYLVLGSRAADGGHQEYPPPLVLDEELKYRREYTCRRDPSLTREQSRLTSDATFELPEVIWAVERGEIGRPRSLLSSLYIYAILEAHFSLSTFKASLLCANSLSFSGTRLVCPTYFSSPWTISQDQGTLAPRPGRAGFLTDPPGTRRNPPI
ncbi:hypothetical protein F511_23402 [Dorcoceras hygrometricum]|uniref:DUF8039 domain-containing protein n=1 Tax=Dorcoceras hygrometricum TaxID=472368 RepID=A0A2Z7C3T1_9LAMI|nr:hypothetical protein F511_23402 [Dorcoceras hygrometricum]